MKYPAIQEVSLPMAIEAEEALLGAILIDPPAIGRVEAIIKPEHFYLSFHSAIYAGMQALIAADQPIDLTSLATFLRDAKTIESPQNLIADLHERAVSAVNIDHYADLILKKWKLRQVITHCGNVASMAREGGADINSVWNYIEANLTALIGDSRAALLPIAEAINLTVAEMEAMLEGDRPPALSTGLPDLDTLLGGGWRGGQLIICAGRPSMGKSAIAGNFLRHAGAIQAAPALLFSLEMGYSEIVKRFWALDLTNPWALRPQNLKALNWDEIGFSSIRLAQTPIMIDPTPAATLDHIRSTCRQVKATQGAIGLVVIDYLQIMGGLEDLNPVQAIGKITKGLKNLARELDAPIVLLSQLSRGVESRQDKRPINSDLRDSGTIEQDSDVILMLYRDEYYNKDSPDRGVAEIGVTKQRAGPTGIVKALFDAPRSRFIPLAVYPAKERDRDDF
jgi:replicative DNA helicase